MGGWKGQWNDKNNWSDIFIVFNFLTKIFYLKIHIRFQLFLCSILRFSYEFQQVVKFFLTNHKSHKLCSEKIIILKHLNINTIKTEFFIQQYFQDTHNTNSIRFQAPSEKINAEFYTISKNWLKYFKKFEMNYLQIRFKQCSCTYSLVFRLPETWSKTITEGELKI